MFPPTRNASPPNIRCSRTLCSSPMSLRMRPARSWSYAMGSILRGSIWRAYDGEPRADEVDVALDLLEPELDVSGQERRARADRHRRDVDDHLVEQSCIGELAGHIASTDDPGVPIAGGCQHLRVNRAHVRVRELDRRAGNGAQPAVREHPARDLVGPLPVR